MPATRACAFIKKAGAAISLASCPAQLTKTYEQGHKINDQGRHQSGHYFSSLMPKSGAKCRSHFLDKHEASMIEFGRLTETP
jgi:hypothetical protein